MTQRTYRTNSAPYFYEVSSTPYVAVITGRYDVAAARAFVDGPDFLASAGKTYALMTNHDNAAFLAQFPTVEAYRDHCRAEAHAAIDKRHPVVDEEGFGPELPLDWFEDHDAAERATCYTRYRMYRHLRVRPVVPANRTVHTAVAEGYPHATCRTSNHYTHVLMGHNERAYARRVAAINSVEGFDVHVRAEWDRAVKARAELVGREPHAHADIPYSNGSSTTQRFTASTVARILDKHTNVDTYVAACRVKALTDALDEYGTADRPVAVSWSTSETLLRDRMGEYTRGGYIGLHVVPCTIK